ALGIVRLPASDVDRVLGRSGEEGGHGLLQGAEPMARRETADPGVPLGKVRPEADELGDVPLPRELVEDVVLEVAGHGGRISRRDEGGLQPRSGPVWKVNTRRRSLRSSSPLTIRRR